MASKKHFIEGKIEGKTEVKGRRRRRGEQLLDDIKETTGYWKWKQEGLYRTLWRTGFGRSCEPVGKQTTE